MRAAGEERERRSRRPTGAATPAWPARAIGAGLTALVVALLLGLALSWPGGVDEARVADERPANGGAGAWVGARDGAGLVTEDELLDSLLVRSIDPSRVSPWARLAQAEIEHELAQLHKDAEVFMQRIERYWPVLDGLEEEDESI